jgi:DNA-directed RNA polymerase II subunit RPB2
MEFNYEKNTFSVIDNMFQNNYLVNKIQQDTYNDFVSNLIPIIIEQYNPLIYKYESEDGKKYELELNIKSSRITYPKVCDNDGTIHELSPSLARLRNYTYSSKLLVDINKKTRIYNNDILLESDEKLIQEVIIGKIPIMVKSKYCINTLKDKTQLDECKYDNGGYFIINGIEKVIVSQERCIDNKGLCFYQKNSKYKYILELKSSVKNKLMPTKPLYIKLYSKDNIINGNYIRIMMPYFKQDIPLFILMRALGFISDKEIIKAIVLDLSNIYYKDVMEVIESSIEDSTNIRTQEQALEYISNNLTNIPRDAKNKEKVYEYINYLLTNEYIPHVGESYIKKGLYTGYLVLKLVMCSLEKKECDDRDSYLNKRIDTTGSLLAALFRQYYTKLVKELKTSCNKEFNNGSWKATDNFHNIINNSNIYKLIKPTIIENGLKFALATGNFGVKNSFNKQGISQLYNKISFNSVNSHLRRINTPIEKCGKLIPPRKQHGTQWGYICPAETPEGQSVGVVKNISLSAIISISSSLLPIIKILENYNILVLDTFKKYSDIQYDLLSSGSKIFLNGEWYGVYNNVNTIYEDLLNYRRSAIINIYTSIIFDTFENELYIYTDSGRFLRPLYIVKNQKFNINDSIIELLNNKLFNWNSLLGISNNYKIKLEDLNKYDKNKIIEIYKQQQNAVIEYLDPYETSTKLIAMNQKHIKNNNYSHCEIHPYLILGAIASTIPFADHNQSPRNTYQSAMGKQSIGICATNFSTRMDTISHILYYPQKPLVVTKSMKYLNTENMPSGINAIIAIATYTGYNQEDSVLMNKSAVERGLFLSGHLKTYKEEEKKNQNSGDEEKFCVPNKNNTYNYKLANYSKLKSNGIVKEQINVEPGDVIIGKTIPHKKKKENTYKDNSIVLKNNEGGHIYKVYMGINGDGYKFCKVQIKNERYPDIGDKFSSRHGQKGTVGMLYKQQDMPFTKDGLVPDIIVNPHAIPSRMTIGQLIECILGKTGTVLGMNGDSTPFTDLDPKKLSDILSNVCGFDMYGNEVLYNGLTGEQLLANIFIGPTFYQRLKHMVIDKYHSRSTGPVVLLTRQPAEGRTRDGGLRFGEMERDCIISHGASAFLKERLLDVSDNYKVFICNKCHMIASVNEKKNIYKCDHCSNTTLFSEVRIPYACKLLIQELISMSIVPRLITS